MRTPDLVYGRPPEEEGAVATLVTKKGGEDERVFHLTREQAWAIHDQLSIWLRLSYKREQDGFQET